MQIKNGASNEILKTLANRVVQDQKGDKFLAGSTLAATNLTDFAQMLDKFNEKANLGDAADKFDADKFAQFASKYFTNVNLSEPKEAAKNGEISVYELTVTGSMKTPAKFYEFMDALQSYENIVKIDFPIKMRKDAEKIDATFGVKIYSLR